MITQIKYKITQIKVCTPLIIFLITTNSIAFALTYTSPNYIITDARVVVSGGETASTNYSFGDVKIGKPFGGQAASGNFALDATNFDVYSAKDSLNKGYAHLYERMDTYHTQGLRLIESFMDPFPASTEYLAFTYDNALAILAFLARGTSEDVARARTLCESLIYVQENDQTFSDGRVRDGYWATDIKDPSGQYSSVKSPGSGCGNMAWTIIAWMHYYKYSNDPDTAFLQKLLQASEKLGDFIVTEFRDPANYGYTGGFGEWEPKQEKYTWKSTEHNLDVYVAFKHLYEVTAKASWLERANHAKQFVTSRMWNPAAGMFWLGTGNDGWTINTTANQQVEDANSWAILALDDVASYGAALSWVENNCAVTCDGAHAGQAHPSFSGFDFNTDQDGVWFEGTAHMALAYQVAGQVARAEYYLNQLRKAQGLALNTNHKGIVAACHDNVSTGFGWDYFPSLHIGATSWYLAAEQNYNPLQ